MMSTRALTGRFFMHTVKLLRSKGIPEIIEVDLCTGECVETHKGVDGYVVDDLVGSKGSCIHQHTGIRDVVTHPEGHLPSTHIQSHICGCMSTSILHGCILLLHQGNTSPCWRHTPC